MSRRWYGSLDNRLMENVHSPEEIYVGMGMTEFGWSDRYAYEVVEVKDQKHVKVRELDHKLVGECYSNDWELTSNEENPVRELTKRGKYWYWTVTFTSDFIDAIDNCEDEDSKISLLLVLAHNGVDADKLREKGKVRKYDRTNVAFGYADYYYDYSF